jgi:hypothetical protein
MYTENSMRGYCVLPEMPESCFRLENNRLDELTGDIKKRSKDNYDPDILSSGDKYCISANLRDGDYYCVDFKANQTTGSGSGSPSGACNSDPASSSYLQCQ